MHRARRVLASQHWLLHENLERKKKRKLALGFKVQPRSQKRQLAEKFGEIIFQAVMRSKTFDLSISDV